VVADPAASPPLSVVIATAEPWPEIRECLESVLHQARSVGAEVVVADGCGRALPEDPAFSDIVWLRESGSSVFRLRALGLSRSRGGVVAVTEDHCRVAPDWCERLLELHARYPEAAAIGGAVENGATGSLLDWMNFLIANGPYMQPIAHGKTRSLTGQANVSFKRAILPSEAEETGHVQMLFNRALRDRGLELILDDRLVVWHIQSLGLAGSCAIHFHNGRTIAGYRRPQLSARGWVLRLGSCLVLPGFLLARAVLTVIQKRRQRVRLALGLPLLAMLVSCHAVGEGVGYLSGPGSSPLRVR
jgi:hypothetical protein